MADFQLILPEILLVVMIAGLLLDEISYHGERARLLLPTALLGYGAALVQALLLLGAAPGRLFSGAIVVDRLSLFAKVFAIILGALVTLLGWRSREIDRGAFAEFAALVAGSSLALCLVSSAADLGVAAVSLLALNLSGYLLAGYGKRSRRSVEAALKYLAFGSVASTLFLFASALLFLATRTLNLSEIHSALIQVPMPVETATVVFALFFLALGFQLGAFPMQLWSADVIEGAPTPISALVTLASRGAGIILSVRLVFAVFAQPRLEPGTWDVMGAWDWRLMVAWVAGVTLLTGGLLAVRQESAKRLVANLVVAETGYLLLGLLILDETSVAALFFNLLVDLFALVGIFAVISHLIDTHGTDRLAEWAGGPQKGMFEVVLLVVFLLSLVGAPPAPGFIGKFALVGAALEHGWSGLALIAIASMGLCIAAVARLAYSLVGNFREQARPLDGVLTPSWVGQGRTHRVFFFALLLPLAFFVLAAESVLALAGQTLRLILW